MLSSLIIADGDGDIMSSSLIIALGEGEVDIMLSSLIIGDDEGAVEEGLVSPHPVSTRAPARIRPGTATIRRFRMVSPFVGGPMRSIPSSVRNRRRMGHPNVNA